MISLANAISIAKADDNQRLIPATHNLRTKRGVKLQLFGKCVWRTSPADNDFDSAPWIGTQTRHKAMSYSLSLSELAGIRGMSEPTDSGEQGTATYAEGYGDNILITKVDNTGRQLVQVVIMADDAGELAIILGSKLNKA